MPKTICVTGASGFIAAVLVSDLLEAGHTVRGTVRSTEDLSKYNYLTDLPGADERLTLFGANLLDEGAFDEAVAGADVVMHTASPYILTVDDPQRDLVDPAIQGTKTVLESCGKSGTVKRVVLTSSWAAVTDEPTGKVYTEADWNETSSLSRNPYYYSKVVAEKAAWALVEDQQPGFDLVVINPNLVVGRSLGPAMNPSNGVFQQILDGVYPGVLDLMWGIADVRDVSRAHILAMDTPGASGRYLCLAGIRTMEEIVNLLREHGYENYKLPGMSLQSGFGTALLKLLSYAQPKGIGMFLRTHLGRKQLADTRKIENDLGMTWRDIDETILATVSDLIKWGHLEKK
jgi:dihydroflavonol-4-reductase